jgi:hypothetical protein
MYKIRGSYHNDRHTHTDEGERGEEEHYVTSFERSGSVTVTVEFNEGTISDAFEFSTATSIPLFLTNRIDRGKVSHLQRAYGIPRSSVWSIACTLESGSGNESVNGGIIKYVRVTNSLECWEIVSGRIKYRVRYRISVDGHTISFIE